MDITQIIYTRATTHAGTTALIGTRFYPGILPQNATLPAVTYQKISDPMVKRVMAGVTNVRYPRVQLDVWAATYAQCEAVAVQLRTAFQDYATSSGGLTLAFTIVDSEFDNHEADNQLFRRTMDLRLWYKL